MQMKLKITVVAAISAAAGVAMAQETVVKIGHVAPISGAQATYGRDNENGALMAIDDLNAAGVVIAGKKVKLQLVAEDDAADPKQGAAVAQKLCDAKVNGVVGHLNSGTTIPASKIYHDCGIPMVTPSATNPNLTKPGYKTTFRLLANDNSLGAGLAFYAADTLKLKRIAVIDDRTAYGQGVAEEFAKAVEAAGGKVVAKEFTTDKATDFTSILTTIKAKKPDVIFFGGMDAVAGPMLKQMKALAMKPKFMGGDGICTTELVKLGGDAIADNQVYCAEAGGVDGEAKVGMDEFKVKYQAKFNTDVKLYAPYVYDAVNVMVAAMVKADSADPAKYLPMLATTTDFKGVSGPISFDEKGDIKNGALTLKTIRAGQLETLAVLR